MRSAIENSEAVSLTILNQTKDGMPFYNNVSLFPVRESNATSRRFTAYQNPVTERMAHYQKLWDLNFSEALIAETLRSSFNLTRTANWLGIMNIDARAYLDNILVKTGTLSGSAKTMRSKIGTGRQTDVINELLETFEQAETKRSVVRPNGKSGEIVDDEYTGVRERLDQCDLSFQPTQNQSWVA